MFVSKVNRLIFKVLFLFFLTFFLILSLPKLTQSWVIFPAFSQQVDGRQLEQQAKIDYDAGNFEEAEKLWQEAAEIHQKNADFSGMLRSQINQSLALRALGLHLQAKQLLLKSYQKLEAEPNSRLKAASLRHLGNTLRLVGEVGSLENVDEFCRLSNANLTSNSIQADLIFTQSLILAQKLQDSQAIAESFLGLGIVANTLFEKEQAIGEPKQAFSQTQKALACYQQATDFFNEPASQVRSSLNYLNLLIQVKQWLLQLSNQEQFSQKNQSFLQNNQLPKIEAELQQKLQSIPDIELKIKQITNPRTAIYAQINLAQSLIKLLEINQAFDRNIENLYPTTKIAQLLTNAVQQAKNLGDTPARSYALGNLGKLYEQTGQFSEAKKLTQAALIFSESMPEIAYLWHWQLGRLFKQNGEIEDAIIAYNNAIQSLQLVRQNLDGINPDVQFSFRDEVEPIYRQLVDLLLPTTEINPDQTKLKQARETIAALQIAELANFLRCNVQKEDPQQIDQVADAHQTAIFYPIILPERLAVIVKLPNQENLLFYQSFIQKNEVNSKLIILKRNLESYPFTAEKQRLAQEVYQWLIAPAENHPQISLFSEKVKTLVFVSDGQLRNIPMAALMDQNKNYLMQKYAVAINLGLELKNPQPFHQKSLVALAAGITQQVRENSPLIYVKDELDDLQPFSSQQLRDEKFNSTQFKNLINSRHFSVVHIATHGKFSSQPEETRIVAWDRDINVNELSELFQTQTQKVPQPIELLVLSACQTAVGDERAILGLAGVSVRSGARSTLAALWYLNDQSSAVLMKHFYHHLKDPKVSNKAEALALAQQEMLKNNNYKLPRFWASYILVGNWL